MKIGINLVGVSYNNALEGGRLRDYESSIQNLYKNVVNPLRDEGHEVKFYLFSYSNEKQDKIIKDYSPAIKYTFVEPQLNKLGGGDKVGNGMKVMTVSYLNSLQQMYNEDLDLVISTRYDINFFRNPFEEYNYDFTKCSFLWREPEFMDLPIVNHPDYVAKINDDNKFPIQKFGALAEHLLSTEVVKKFHIPKECSTQTMKTSHSLEYINHIRNKTLDIKLQKKNRVSN